MDTIGFIGLGRLGSPIAQSIRKAGFPMVVYDLREGATGPLLKSEAQPAASPDEVAGLSDVILTCVPGPKEVEEVALGPHGVLNGIKEGSVYIDLSTSRPSLIQQIGRTFQEKGAHVLDAPVHTNPADAANRHVTVMPSGEREIYDGLRPLFESFADKIVYQGNLGMGSICKLVINMMVLAEMQVVAEGLTLGIKAGLELPALMEAGDRGLLGRHRKGLERTVFRGQFELPSFRQALARKDIGMATDLGRELNVSLPVVNVVEQLYIQCANRGWGDLDTHVTYRLQEDASGVEVRCP